MPTIVGILTFISRINFLLSWAWKKLYNLRAWLLWVSIEGLPLWTLVKTHSEFFSVPITDSSWAVVKKVETVCLHKQRKHSLPRNSEICKECRNMTEKLLRVTLSQCTTTTLQKSMQNSNTLKYTRWKWKQQSYLCTTQISHDGYLRIYHECGIEKSIWGSPIGITRLAEWWQSVSDRKKQIFLSNPHTNNGFFFLLNS